PSLVSAVSAFQRAQVPSTERSPSSGIIVVPPAPSVVLVTLLVPALPLVSPPVEAAPPAPVVVGGPVVPETLVVPVTPPSVVVVGADVVPVAVVPVTVVVCPAPVLEATLPLLLVVGPPVVGPPPVVAAAVVPPAPVVLAGRPAFEPAPEPSPEQATSPSPPRKAAERAPEARQRGVIPETPATPLNARGHCFPWRIRCRSLREAFHHDHPRNPGVWRRVAVSGRVIPLEPGTLISTLRLRQNLQALCQPVAKVAQLVDSQRINHLRQRLHWKVFEQPGENTRIESGVLLHSVFQVELRPVPGSVQKHQVN